MTGEDFHVLHRRRHEELLAEAAAARAARRCRGPARPGPLLRLYARLWWASRPRAGRWAGEFLAT